ncbi:MAG: CDP-alcohol phosphatidyltransferase family protein [Chlamydiota bacterium]
MKQFYLIPNVITAFALSCGLFVIFKVNLSEPGSSVYELLYSSVLLLLLAAFADLLDGAVARMIRAESEFGSMFDSLADAISFGVAPSVLFLKSLTLEQGSGLSFFAVVGAMVYAICGILRLVRFNVQMHAVRADKQALLIYQKNFTGLPIPASAAGAISINLFFHSSFFQGLGLSYATKVVSLAFVMIALGYLMISKWKFPSLKTFRIRIPSFRLVLTTVVIVIFILYGIFYFLPLVLMICSLGYILSGCILRVVRLFAGKKSKTLADYEPDSDE